MAHADKICEHCGKLFHMNTSPAIIKRQRLCSRSCGFAVLRQIPSFEDRMSDRLAERSELQNNGCILYTGQNNGRYGQIEYKRKTYLAHRVAYQLAKGNIPKGQFVCHQCDTPLCINPEHLWVGSPAENNLDMVKKNRARHVSIRKISDETVAFIRAAIVQGEFQRVIADKVGVSRSYISMIASGIRRPEAEPPPC